MSASFQSEARAFAHRAAESLRTAAAKLEATFDGDPLPQHSMEAVEALGRGVWSAQSCVAHATHQNGLAILHRERERNEGAS